MTEKVYRKQIRPVITKGAEVMDRIFPDVPRDRSAMLTYSVGYSDDKGHDFRAVVMARPGGRYWD